MMEWRLKKGNDERIRTGHPWVFASELDHSPRNIQPGDEVLLVSHKGDFLARGYGNPASQICFRALSHYGPDRSLPLLDILNSRLDEAWMRRHQMGFKGCCRLVFSEADRLPGLIVDYYIGEMPNMSNHKQSGSQQVLSYQVLTAGMQKIMNDHPQLLQNWIVRAFEKGLILKSVENFQFVNRSDVNIRKLEGLEVPEAQVLSENPEGLRNFKAHFNKQGGSLASVDLLCDLVEGQKTGLFLDQTHNLELVLNAAIARSSTWIKRSKKIRILDLCCYVGQWSLNLAKKLKELGFEVECHLLDVSNEALQRAENNLKHEGFEVVCHKLDVLKDVLKWPEGPFEIIISDPPAFVKNRRDLGAGEAAYSKLNLEAFKRAARSGLVVSCTCSGVLDHDNFEKAVAKAMLKSGRRGSWIARGQQGEDHPVLANFPEGRYLKMILTEVFH